MRAALARHDELVVAMVLAHGGTVFKHTGDGLAATFATPSAAVASAVEMQRALGREDFDDVGGLRVRAGIHVGEAEARRNDWFGITVSRCARLMDAAAGGQVLASEATVDALGSACPDGITFRDLGEHVLRDLARPERIHQVEAAGLRTDFPPLRARRPDGGDAIGVSGQTPAALGRRDEHRAMRSVLEQARSEPALLVLEGEAGIGKSALWRDGVVSARLHGMTVLQAVAPHPSAALAFGVLGDLLAHVADDELRALPVPQSQALEVVLLRRSPGTGGVDWRAAAVGLRTLLADWSGRRPVLVAVDDLPWSDASSLRVLEHALRRLDGRPVTLFATVRTGAEEVPVPWLGDVAPNAHHRVTIGRMAIEELSEVVRTRLDRRIPPRIAERIAARAEGNPLLALELARGTDTDGGGSSSSSSEHIRQLVEERLRGLAATTRSMLAVLGLSTSPSVTLLERLVPGDLELALDEAQDARLLVVDSGRVQFAHPLYGHAVRGALRDAEARAIHRRLAQAVDDPVERGHHLARAAVIPDEEVARTLEQAADTALDRGGSGEASELAERALDLTPPGETVASVRRGLLAAGAAASVHEVDRTVALLDRLEGLDLSPSAWARVQLARLEWVEDDVGRSLQVLGRIRELVLDDPEIVVRAGVAESVAHLVLGDLPSAARVGRQALARAVDLHDPSLAVATRAIAGQVEDLMGLVSGRQLLEEAVQAATVTPPPPGPMATYDAPVTALGLSRMYGDDLDGAREMLQLQLDRATAAGQEPAQVGLRVHLAELAVRAGRLGDAEDHLAVIDDLEGPGAAVAPHVTYVHSLVDASRGRIEAARRSATAGLDLAVRYQQVIWQIANRGVLGFLDLSLGNAAAADAHLSPIPVMLRRMQVAPVVHPIAPDAIEAAVAVGDLERADELVVELAARGDAVPGVWTAAMAVRGRALVAATQGQMSLALDTLGHLFELHGDLPDPHVRARNELVAGTIHRRAGNRGVARDHLEHAVAGFEEVGTPLWADRARDELARVSGRRRKAPDRGLTATEEQVAALAADGLTNREIAARLFLSPKTVEHNLTRIYRKLGVRSRTELAAARHDE